MSEERLEKEEQLVKEILAKVDELAQLFREDYDEILDPRNGVTDTQGIDQYIDDFLRQIIKKLREAGYGLPNSCVEDCECELFREEDP